MMYRLLTTANSCWGFVLSRNRMSIDIAASAKEEDLEIVISPANNVNLFSKSPLKSREDRNYNKFSHKAVIASE